VAGGSDLFSPIYNSLFKEFFPVSGKLKQPTPFSLSTLYTSSVVWGMQDSSSFFLVENLLPVNLLSDSLVPSFTTAIPSETVFNLSDSGFETQVVAHLTELASSYVELGQLQYSNDIFALNAATLVERPSTVQNHCVSVDFLENSRFIKRTQGLNVPLRLVKFLFHDSTATDLFLLQWGDGSSEIKHKLKPYTTYLTFKQKRYKRKKFINFTSKTVKFDDKLVNVK
jgi:hypothetical protein